MPRAIRLNDRRIKSSRKLCWGAALLLTVLTAAEARASEAPVVTLSLSKSRVELGTPFSVFLQVSTVGATTVRLPAALDLGAELAEIERRAQVSRSAGRVLHTFEIELVALNLGELEIPELTVFYRSAAGELEVRSTPMRVTSYGTIRGSDAEFREVAPLSVIRPDYSTLYWSLGIVLGALVLTMVGLWIVRAFRRFGASASEAVSAIERARRRLDRLEGSGALEGERCRPAYVEMSEVVREFITSELKISALDATTSELSETLERAPLDSETRESIIAWLKEADAVKFAGYSPNADEALAALYTVRRWMEDVHKAELKRGADET